MQELTQVTNALSAIRAPVVLEEGALHTLVAEALTRAGLPYSREARLGPGARVDFLCGGVAVEVKRGKPPYRTLEAQLRRYAAFDDVRAVLLVTERWANVPQTVCGKPCRALSLRRMWGVSLP